MAKPKTTGPTGIEPDIRIDELTKTAPTDKITSKFSLDAQHLRLTQVIFQDQSDDYNELVQELHWQLHPSHKVISLKGNLFVIEDLSTSAGRILMKQTPLPHARTMECSIDLLVTPKKPTGFEFTVFEPIGAQVSTLAVIEYQDGLVGRTRALQQWQRAQRPSCVGHTVPQFLSNTWGDRSRDNCVRHNFIESEIRAAQKLGVDIVQIDVGWQRGVTSNSAAAKEKGGVWEGFYNADSGFWTVDTERFPNGLEPLIKQAAQAGVKIGLWFAPDSWDDFANWRKDADVLLNFHKTLGVEHFKIDGVNATTEESNQNLRRFLAAVMTESKGQIVLDFDITAQKRPGYFGMVDVGPLFVQNRYTDWHNYWPHQTLRTLWKLAWWVDPVRLRMEFLNHSRNAQLYPNDPLAPLHYSPDTLFATIMFSNPLGWFEMTNLPASYFEKIPPLVKTWKAHRENLFSGTIIPIGHEPDGFSYTGFLSLSSAGDNGYVLLFRERNTEGRSFLGLPGVAADQCRWELLAGDGKIDSHGKGLSAEIPMPLGYLFGRFVRK